MPTPSATDAHAALGGGSLNRLAFRATVHCLTGCAIGEVLGMSLATWWGSGLDWRGPRWIAPRGMQASPPSGHQRRRRCRTAQAIDLRARLYC
jgi:hypothetical protein